MNLRWKGGQPKPPNGLDSKFDFLVKTWFFKFSGVGFDYRIISRVAY